MEQNLEPKSQRTKTTKQWTNSSYKNSSDNRNDTRVQGHHGHHENSKPVATATEYQRETRSASPIRDTSTPTGVNQEKKSYSRDRRAKNYTGRRSQEGNHSNRVANLERQIDKMRLEDSDTSEQKNDGKYMYGKMFLFDENYGLV
jgi:hypothetical protein